MKIMLVANTGWYLYNFRRNLSRELREAGSTVVFVCPHDRYVPMLQASGFRWVPWNVHRSSMNPCRELSAVCELIRIYRRERPALVHHFTIKCIVYGTLAAKLAGVRSVVNAVTGLGHVYLSSGLKTKLVRPFIHRWYSWALTTPGVRAMFQNTDDLAVLACAVPHLAKRAVLSNGSGVDLTRFSPVFSPKDQRPNGRPCVLFAGRLIRQKGIHEFVEAARIIRGRGVQARFLVCGETDPGNPSTVDPDLCRQWHNDGIVELLGHVDRIEDVIRQSAVVVLPSYREGTPRVLLEAAAMAKPIVATDVPGCREVVVHRENGLLVAPRDANELADGIETMLHDEKMRNEMGRAGRKRAVRQFDERNVIRDTLQVYAELLGEKHFAQAIA